MPFIHRKMTVSRTGEMKYREESQSLPAPTRPVRPAAQGVFVRRPETPKPATPPPPRKKGTGPVQGPVLGPIKRR
jgi:hypothetical protein